MAKNTGLIKFTGKVGHLSARQTQYGNIISTPGGFKGERIKTEERYEATRQLGTEFGRCSKIASQLYSTLAFYLQTLPHGHMYGSVQSLITNIKGCDATSPKGERTFGIGLQTEQGRKMMHHFSFNPKRSQGSVMAQSYGLVMEEGSLIVPDFDVQKVSFPKKVERLGIQLALLRLDAEAPSCRMETSPLVLVSKEDEIADLRLEAAVPEGEGFLLALLYFGFCNEVAGEAYFLRHPKNVLEVIGVL